MPPAHPAISIGMTVKHPKEGSVISRVVIMTNHHYDGHILSPPLYLVFPIIFRLLKAERLMVLRADDFGVSAEISSISGSSTASFSSSSMD